MCLTPNSHPHLTETNKTTPEPAQSVSSTLPAFAKKGDLIIADEGVYEPLKTALDLSRSQIRYFKHNDAADLERVLQGIAEEDKRKRRSVLEQRRFIAVRVDLPTYLHCAALPCPAGQAGRWAEQKTGNT